MRFYDEVQAQGDRIFCPLVDLWSQRISGQEIQAPEEFQHIRDFRTQRIFGPKGFQASRSSVLRGF